MLKVTKASGRSRNCSEVSQNLKAVILLLAFSITKCHSEYYPLDGSHTHRRHGCDFISYQVFFVSGGILGVCLDISLLYSPTSLLPSCD